MFEDYRRVEKKLQEKMAHQLRVLAVQFNSQHLQGSLQLSITPKGPTPSSAYLGHCTHTVHTHVYMQAKVDIHIKMRTKGKFFKELKRTETNKRIGL